MPRLTRNLLLMAALCGVAPAAAFSASSGEDCQDDRESRTVVILADDAPGGVPLSAGRRALLP